MYFCGECRGVHDAQAESRPSNGLVVCSRYRGVGQAEIGELTLHDHIRARESVREPLDGSCRLYDGVVVEVT